MYKYTIQYTSVDSPSEALMLILRYMMYVRPNKPTKVPDTNDVNLAYLSNSFRLSARAAINVQQMC